jgi:hypothetical protein
MRAYLPGSLNNRAGVFNIVKWPVFKSPVFEYIFRKSFAFPYQFGFHRLININISFQPGKRVSR